MPLAETPSKADISLALGSGQIMCSLHTPRPLLASRRRLQYRARQRGAGPRRGQPVTLILPVLWRRYAGELRVERGAAGLSRRLLNLAERGGSGAQHTALATVVKIAAARVRGDTDIAVPLRKMVPGGNAGLDPPARRARTAVITRRARLRPRAGGRWRARRGRRAP